MLVVPGAGDESQLGRIRAPLHIGKSLPSACNMVTDSGTMRIRGHLKSYNARAVNMNHNSMDLKNVFISGKGIFPGMQLGMSHIG
jgi:hypothetical protein